MSFQRSTYFSVSGFRVPIRNTVDYSPFGVQLDGRTIQGDFYRYGFQNLEKDDEIKGVGNSVNYTFRMYDSRVGRFFAIDPLAAKFPWNSVYAFSENKVIAWGELEGLESFFAADGTKIGQIGSSTQVYVVSDENIKMAQKHIEWANDPSDHGKKYAADNTKAAKLLGKDLEMTEEELYLRAAMDVIQSHEGGTGNKRYYKVNGPGTGGEVSDLESYPTEEERAGGSGASGAYQIMPISWLSNSTKLGLTDFSEESQDKVCVQIFKNRGVYDNIISGDFQTAVDVMKGSCFTCTFR